MTKSFLENINKLADKSESLDVLATSIEDIGEATDKLTTSFENNIDEITDDILVKVDDEVKAIVDVLSVEIEVTNGVVFKASETPCKTLTANYYRANVKQSEEEHLKYNYLWTIDNKPILVDENLKMVTFYDGVVPENTYFTNDSKFGATARDITVCIDNISHSSVFTVELNLIEV